mmetsp:Transcript_4605/g.14883  ORF Transcript_4605/g.14883 Transcript_4605/m.14883 type:complete len:450 (-) Transcript_4605:87-1436(-)
MLPLLVRRLGSTESVDARLGLGWAGSPVRCLHDHVAIHHDEGHASDDEGEHDRASPKSFLGSHGEFAMADGQVPHDQSGREGGAREGKVEHALLRRGALDAGGQRVAQLRGRQHVAKRAGLDALHRRTSTRRASASLHHRHWRPRQEAQPPVGRSVCQQDLPSHQLCERSVIVRADDERLERKPRVIPAHKGEVLDQQHHARAVRRPNLGVAERRERRVAHGCVWVGGRLVAEGDGAIVGRHIPAQDLRRGVGRPRRCHRAELCDLPLDGAKVHALEDLIRIRRVGSVAVAVAELDQLLELQRHGENVLCVSQLLIGILREVQQVRHLLERAARASLAPGLLVVQHLCPKVVWCLHVVQRQLALRVVATVTQHHRRRTNSAHDRVQRFAGVAVLRVAVPLKGHHIEGAVVGRAVLAAPLATRRVAVISMANMLDLHEFVRVLQLHLDCC